jgi:hypothetical protein
MPSWLTGAALAFVLKEISSAGAGANWPAVKTAVNTAVADHLPAFAVPGVDGVADAIVDDVAKALQDTADLAKVANDVIGGNFVAALTDLEALVVKVVSPTQPMTLAAVRCALAAAA